MALLTMFFGIQLAIAAFFLGLLHAPMLTAIVVIFFFLQDLYTFLRRN